MELCSVLQQKLSHIAQNSYLTVVQCDFFAFYEVLKSRNVIKPFRAFCLTYTQQEQPFERGDGFQPLQRFHLHDFQIHRL